MMKWYAWLVVICVQAMHVQSVSAEENTHQQSVSRWNVVSEALTGVLEQGKVAGIQVVIQHKGKTVYNQAVGYRDIGSQSLLQTDSMYRIYSMTKPM